MKLPRPFGPGLRLSFDARESVLVRQTATHWALHADVFFTAESAAPISLNDAHLAWEVRRGRKPLSVIKTLAWDRAVVEGKLRHPAQPLSFEVTSGPRPLTLTFDDGLIKVPPGLPPSESYLVLALALSGRSKPFRRDIWRVRLESWEQERADLEWLASRPWVSR